MLISEIRDEVMTDVGADVNDSTLANKIFSFIKSSLRRFPSYMQNKCLQSKKTVAITTGQQTFSYPQNTISIESVYFEKDGKRKEVFQAKDSVFFNSIHNTTEKKEPTGYFVYGNLIELSNPSDSSYTLNFNTISEIDSVSLSDTFLHSSQVAEILKDGVKGYYFGYVEDRTSEATYFKLFREGLDRLEINNQVEQMPDYIGLSENKNFLGA